MPTFFRRILYFGYYIKEMDLKRFRMFLRYSSAVSGRSVTGLLADSIFSVFRYNISPSDYFYFRFYSTDREERRTWAGTGFMYEYQLKMNPGESRKVLENKVAFNNMFSQMVKREYYTIEDLRENRGLAEKLLGNRNERIVLKNAHGQAGRQVQVLETKGITYEALIKIMSSGVLDLAEEYIIQHQEMMKLSPSGVNTVRVITQILNGKVLFIAARLRISVNSDVDNLAAGNAAAPVDLITGTVTGPAVFSDITREDISTHPVTGAGITGFRIPFWPDVLEMVREAALMIPANRSVGWDVAITPDGPALVEGNHNWCKLLWQLPVKKGLKKDIEQYL